MGSCTRAIMHGRAPPAPLAEIGRLLTTADHCKPLAQKQMHHPAPRQASVLRAIAGHYHVRVGGITTANYFPAGRRIRIGEIAINTPMSDAPPRGVPEPDSDRQ